MFKEHLVFILVHVASAPIFSPVDDQHPVATTDDELIEDVDPVAPDVDSIAIDVAMDRPLIWVMYQIQMPSKKSLLVLNPTFGSMQRKMR